jgi:hypothetical protein
VAIVQYRDQDATTPAPPGGHERPPLRGPGSPGGKGRIIGLVLGAVVVVSLVAVALAAGGGHHRPIAAPVVRTSKPRSATPTTVARAVPTTAPVTSTAVPPRSTTPTAVPSAPPIATPATIAPSVTAGTAVPWSPTSPRTLVGENGDPKDWPAAQPTPPSLAGAYSDNMMTVMVTLMAYQDWVDAHPNPALVSNYVQDGGGLYNEDKSEIEQLVQRDWRVNPAPTEIDWLAVTSPPVPMLIHGKPGFRNGHELYLYASVTIIYARQNGGIFNSAGKVVGYVSTRGKWAFSVTLSQGTDARWRIGSMVRLHPVHGLGSLAR